ncbi:MAG: hypothetical protein R2710_21870 [Acidimicrobiales bacterium]
MMWLAIAISVGVLIDVSAVKVLVVALGIIGSYWILVRVPTKAAVLATG